MELNETLLRDFEEFSELIVNEEKNVVLDRAVESLRNFIERDVDGWTEHTESELARIAQHRLMEIWGLISKAEKKADPDLREYYDNIVTELEEISGYETDDDEEFEQ